MPRLVLYKRRTLLLLTEVLTVYENLVSPSAMTVPSPVSQSHASGLTNKNEKFVSDMVARFVSLNVINTENLLEGGRLCSFVKTRAVGATLVTELQLRPPVW